MDELTPIARYMAGEMNTNAAGTDCRRMAELNAVSGQRCIIPRPGDTGGAGAPCPG